MLFPQLTFSLYSPHSLPLNVLFDSLPAFPRVSVIFYLSVSGIFLVFFCSPDRFDFRPFVRVLLSGRSLDFLSALAMFFFFTFLPGPSPVSIRTCIPSHSLLLSLLCPSLTPDSLPLLFHWFLPGFVQLFRLAAIRVSPLPPHLLSVRPPPSVWISFAFLGVCALHSVAHQEESKLRPISGRRRDYQLFPRLLPLRPITFPPSLYSIPYTRVILISGTALSHRQN